MARRRAGSLFRPGYNYAVTHGLTVVPAKGSLVSEILSGRKWKEAA